MKIFVRLFIVLAVIGIAFGGCMQRHNGAPALSSRHKALLDLTRLAR